MTISRRFWLTFPLIAVAPGCSGTGSFLSPAASSGSLKTSLSHMEYENRQLQTRLSKLETEGRENENRLIQEQTANEELTARLNDARTLLGQKDGPGAGDLDSAARTTLPAAQSNQTKRKPPFAQIPGRIDSIPNELEDDRRRDRSADPFGPQSRADGPLPWLPVATGTTEPSTPIR